MGRPVQNLGFAFPVVVGHVFCVGTPFRWWKRGRVNGRTLPWNAKSAAGLVG